jgi:hypothetical protein
VSFLTIHQVLTGEQPFRNIKPLELAYHVSFGARPEKPANAEAIGISDSLWKLMQRCWEGDRTQRPRIQEVVAGIGDAATDWHTDMPPSSTEHREDSDEEDSDELKYSKFSLVLIAPFFYTFRVVQTFESYLNGGVSAADSDSDAEEDSDELKHSKFPLVSIALPPFDLLCSSDIRVLSERRRVSR